MSVQALTQEERTRIIDALAQEINGIFVFEGVQDRMSSLLTITENLDACPDDLIMAFREEFTNPTHTSRYNLGPLLTRSITPITIREFLTLTPLVPRERVATPVFARILRGLHSYQQLPARADYSTSDGVLKQQVLALLSVTARLYAVGLHTGNGSPYVVEGRDNNHDEFYRMREDGLVDLVVERPAAASLIAETAIERKTTDAEAIRAVLDVKAPSLSHGAL